MFLNLRRYPLTSLRPITMSLFAGILSLLLFSAEPAAAAPAAASSLRIYFIDVEGGQATLFITPTGQSLLIDTGWAGHNFRDADRILAAAKDAGLTRIDFVLITHFHADHIGGVPQLAARIRIGAFIDHGENRELDEPGTVRDFAGYLKLIADHHYKRLVVHPGDTLPITGLTASIVSADGDLLAHALPSAGQPNPTCASTAIRPLDTTENARSVGTHITFGHFKLLDLGDLTWDKERPLVCPVNKLGTVDVLVVSHHGFNQSSSPALVNAVHPRVAIMDNGATKGGSTAVLDTIRQSPGLEALWQLHFSNEGGPAHNTPEAFIANPTGPDAAHFLKLTAQPDGTFTVFNSRTRITVPYGR